MVNPFTEHFFTATFYTVHFWFLAMLLICISYKVLDKVILREIHLTPELQKGNIAVAIVISAFLIGMSLVIYGVTN